MIKVSKDFYNSMKIGNNYFKEYLTITLQNGTILHLTEADVWGGSLTIDEAVSEADTFGAVGSCIINSLSFTLNNIDERFSQYDFSEATVQLALGLLVNGEPESYVKGIYTVTEPPYFNDSLLNFGCVDNMVKFDQAYPESSISFPATIKQVMDQICATCGVVFDTVSFPNENVTVGRLENNEVTCREVMSWIASIAGCYARIKRNGHLEFGRFTQASLSGINVRLDGGVFDDGYPEYTTGDDADGGDFTFANDPSSYDAGLFVQTMNVHTIDYTYEKHVSLTPATITGVRTYVEYKDSQDNKSKDQEFLVGTTDYVVDIETNPFFTLTNAPTILNTIAQNLIGLSYYRVEATTLPDMTFEPGDYMVLKDKKGAWTYPAIVSRCSFNVGNRVSVYSDAEPIIQNQYTRSTEASKIFKNLRQRITDEATVREQAIAALESAIEANGGLFTTVEPVQGGGNIYYLHNEPLLANSNIVWKMTADAFSVSTDGGTTYTAGLTVDGTLIANIMSTIGLDFSWGTGGTLTLGGANNINGWIRMLDASNNQIGMWDRTGFESAGTSYKTTIKDGQINIKNLATGSDDYSVIDVSAGDLEDSGMSFIIHSNGSGGKCFYWKYNNAIVTAIQPVLVDDNPDLIDSNPWYVDGDLYRAILSISDLWDVEHIGFYDNSRQEIYMFGVDAAKHLLYSNKTLEMQDCGLYVYDSSLTVGTSKNYDGYSSSKGVFIQNSDNGTLGYFNGVMNTTLAGNAGVSMGAHRNIGNSSYWNGVNLFISSAGEPYVSFSSAAAWRRGLGVAAQTTVTTATTYGGTCTIRKYWDGHVDIYGELPSFPAATTDTSAIIPSGYRPAHVIYLTGVGGSNTPRAMAIYANGSIRGYSYTTTGLYFSASYTTVLDS